MRTNFTLKKLYVVVLLIGFTVSSVNAADIVSAQSGPWTSSGTWVGGVVPTKDDNVTIAVGHTVTYFVSGTTTIDLCKDLIVEGTLQASCSINQNFNTSVLGSIVCNGIIEFGQTAPATGMILTLKSNTSSITGSGSMHTRTINLNVNNTTCVLSVPTVNLSHGLYVSAINSKLIVQSGANVTIPNTGNLTVAQNGGQGAGVSFMDIYGTVNVGTILLCNNATGTDKSAINVKNGGVLNVAASFSPIRTAGTGITGTIGGSGLVFTIENGGSLNWTSPATDPKLLTDPGNNPYDPKLEVVYLTGSYINGQVTQTTSDLEVKKDDVSIQYNSSDNTIRIPDDAKSIRIFSLLGSLVLNKINPENQVQLPELKKGIYLIALTDKAGNNTSLKINL